MLLEAWVMGREDESTVCISGQICDHQDIILVLFFLPSTPLPHLCLIELYMESIYSGAEKPSITEGVSSPQRQKTDLTQARFS